MGILLKEVNRPDIKMSGSIKSHITVIACLMVGELLDITNPMPDMATTKINENR